MSSLGGIIYLLEIFLAEVIFFYSCPRRKHFVIRLIVCIAVSFLIGYLLPIPSFGKYFQLYSFFRYLFLIALTFLSAWICFDLKWDIILAFCVAAVGLQHISYRVSNIIFIVLPFDNPVIRANIMFFELLVCIFIYILAFFLFGRTAAKKGYYKNCDKRLNLVSILIIFICIVMTRFTRAENLNESFIVNLYAIMCCMLALLIQFSIHRMLLNATEKKTMEKLWEEERKQYDITKQTIDTINMKCHNLKHKILDCDSLPEKDETRELIRIYDNSLKTGNKVLNVVMMDYGLRYGKENVEITFMGDGSCLSFMEDSDLYSLLGNAVSNAVEAVLKLKEEKRTVSITVEQRGDFIALGVSNHFDGELKYEGEELQTTKNNEKLDHGYGVRSIKLIAQKYGGEMKVSVQKDVFHLSVYFVRKEKK